MPDKPMHLQSCGGEIYCHVFENESTGLTRGLFWCVTLNVVPPTGTAPDFSSTLTCDWLRWPTRRWRELDGATAQFGMDNTEKEASMYWFSHHPAKQASISLAYQSGNTFQSSMQLDVQYVDVELARLAGSSMVEAKGLVSFTGLIIVPENIGIAHSDTGLVDKAAGDFVDLSAYEEREVCESGYRYRPIWNA